MAPSRFPLYFCSQFFADVISQLSGYDLGSMWDAEKRARDTTVGHLIPSEESRECEKRVENERVSGENDRSDDFQIEIGSIKSVSRRNSVLREKDDEFAMTSPKEGIPHHWYNAVVSERVRNE